MNKPGLSPATILVVDDTPANLRLMEDVLRSGGYEVRAFPRGPLALAAAERTPPDLVLLDVMMPGMDGYQVCERLKASPVTREIPVIFLTARTDADDEARGFELGAVDYITKPVSPALLLARLRTHLLLKRAHDFLRDKSDYLEQEVRRRSAEILETRDITIAAMAALAETRDQETGQHIWRTQEYVRELALGLAAHPRFSSYLTLETIDLLYKSAPLHDIGKVGIPDAILRKAGAFTPEEFDLMKRHTLLGRNAIMAAEQRLAVPTPFLTMARDIAGSHHERWDGSGYPRRPGRRPHPRGRPPHGPGRCLRRPHHRPPLQARLVP